ncbi:MAG TPA: hypothetical protein VGY76_02475 [Solirubrobacteraceae bacterium]|jgi:hypothetical protein|nr:hypothetical protein [Solirubrobacteraceae bacterium]
MVHRLVCLVIGVAASLPLLGVPSASADSCPNAPVRTGAAAGLPDCRGFELVSPADSPGEAFTPNVFTPNSRDLQTYSPLRAAADGSGVAYVEDAPIAGGNGAAGHGFGNQYLATRSAAGWSSSDITPPGTTSETQYEAFSADLSQGVLVSEGYTGPALTPDAPPKCFVMYSRNSGDGSYHALFSETQTPRWCGFPEGLGNGDTFVFAGASDDRSQLFFQSQAALIPGATEASGRFGNNLYDSIGGRLALVNVLPNGTYATDATFGTLAEEESQRLPDFSGVVSKDGARVYWTDLATGKVYLRENPAQPQGALNGEGRCVEPTRGCTVQVSGGGSALYWTATPDGRYAYYTENGELWRFDAQSDAREALAGPGSDVRGVIGVNETGEDGAYLYFVAGGALAPGAEAGVCGEPAGGIEEAEESKGLVPPGKGCNLYILRGNAHVRFIATLVALDDHFASPLGIFGDWRSSLGLRTAEVTPDGHSLLFESSVHLAEAAGAKGGGIFVYDADSARISCASCDPSGLPPLELQAKEPKDAFSLPVSRRAAFMPRWISADGSRVFFDSSEQLVPQGENAQDGTGLGGGFGSGGIPYENVFEWEREGTAGCPQSVPVRVNGGCVSLLSDGASLGDAFFVEASVSGNDAFFVSREDLVPQAVGNHMKLYDARVDGGFPAPVEAASCVGEACRGGLSGPAGLGTVGSTTFSGGSNLPPPTTVVAPRKATKKKPVKCSRGKRHRKCVRQGAKAKKRSTDNRRGK